jgi:hypothetical protein
LACSLSARLDDSADQYAPEGEAEEDKNGVVDRFAPHIGAGLDWALSNWLALSVDARYNIVKTWVEELPREGRIGEVVPTKLDQINLSALTLTLGLKFYF